jgi:hypothetical protein
MSEKFVDPVVAEVHAARAAMLEAVGGDVGELMRQVASRQQQSHRRIVREPLRKRPEVTDEREWRLTSVTRGTR